MVGYLESGHFSYRKPISGQYCDMQHISYIVLFILKLVWEFVSPGDIVERSVVRIQFSWILSKRGRFIGNTETVLWRWSRPINVA